MTVQGLAKSFGKVAAVDGVDMTVRPASIHGLVGPNGSGKTTMLNLLSGLASADTGSIRILGSEATRLPADAIARLGVGRTFQTPRIFDSMTVWTNFRIGPDHLCRGAAEQSREALREARLEAVRPSWEASMPDVLPHAQRRLLEVLRVVARRPRILLLDEPAAGLSTEERGQFADLLRRLRDSFGYTIILVEHDLNLVWKVADHITVLDAGRVVDDGPPQQIVDNPAVRALFTGETNAEVSGLHAGYGRVPVLRDIDLTVQPGEIALVLGPNGGGKTTLLRTIAGFIAPSAGSIRFAGTSIAGWKPEAISQSGLRLVLEGHRVFPDLTVADNIRIGTVVGGQQASTQGRIDRVLDVFPMLRSKYRDPARDLSGGQQQMLALAQAFVAQPSVLLCDEPSLGLAQAILPPILDFLVEWTKEGTAVLIVEQQIELAMRYATRAMVLEQGQIRLAGTAEELADDPRVRQIYLGLE